MPEVALFPGGDGAAGRGVHCFDRDDGDRVHVHAARELLHAPRRYAALDDENLLRMGKILTRGPEGVEKLVRLMAFNVRIGDRHDHSRNFSVLPDAKDRRRLAPACDLTPSQGMDGAHARMVNGRGRASRTGI